MRTVSGCQANGVVPPRRSAGYRKGRCSVSSELQGIAGVVSLPERHSLAMCCLCLHGFVAVSRCGVVVVVMSRVVQPFVVGRLFEGKEGMTYLPSYLEDLELRRS